MSAAERVYRRDALANALRDAEKMRVERDAAIRRAEYAGHRTTDAHDCFAMRCYDLARDLAAALRSQESPVGEVSRTSTDQKPPETEAR